MSGQDHTKSNESQQPNNNTNGPPRTNTAGWGFLKYFTPNSRTDTSTTNPTVTRTSTTGSAKSDNTHITTPDGGDQPQEHQNRLPPNAQGRWRGAIGAALGVGRLRGLVGQGQAAQGTGEPSTDKKHDDHHGKHDDNGKPGPSSS
ncbi:MAG: hypothetical protein Q9159_001854 [Coniocarpon cinnabarinum]